MSPSFWSGYPDNEFPDACGGFADVWIGTWVRDSVASKVAVKVLRSVVSSEECKNKIKKRLRRELRVWQRLDHPNILPLYGTSTDFGLYGSMICPWLKNGNLNKYLGCHGTSFVLEDRFRILRGVVDGLSYLHKHSIVHGDLTGSNVLITDDGSACLCDFGLSTIVAELQGDSFFTSSISGAVRWAAPELYRVGGDDVPPTVTTYSDIYSFGCVMLQVLTGNIPYHYLKMDVQVLLMVHKGHIPLRPQESIVTDEYWNFMKQCWSPRLRDRPTVDDVCYGVRNLA